jgi:hypothetical protein
MKHMLLAVAESISEKKTAWLVLTLGLVEPPSYTGVVLIDQVFSDDAALGSLVGRAMVIDVSGDADAVVHDLVANHLGDKWHVTVHRAVR